MFYYNLVYKFDPLRFGLNKTVGVSILVRTFKESKCSYLKG